jgi:hypothetical protein
MLHSMPDKDHAALTHNELRAAAQRLSYVMSSTLGLVHRTLCQVCCWC